MFQVTFWSEHLLAKLIVTPTRVLLIFNFSPNALVLLHSIYLTCDVFNLGVLALHILNFVISFNLYNNLIF